MFANLIAYFNSTFIALNIKINLLIRQFCSWVYLFISIQLNPLLLQLFQVFFDSYTFLSNVKYEYDDPISFKKIQINCMEKFKNKIILTSVKFEMVKLNNPKSVMQIGFPVFCIKIIHCCLFFKLDFIQLLL